MDRKYLQHLKLKMRLFFFLKNVLENISYYSWDLLDRSKVRNVKKNSVFFWCAALSKNHKSFNISQQLVQFFCEMTAWNLLVLSLSQLFEKNAESKN